MVGVCRASESNGVEIDAGVAYFQNMEDEFEDVAAGRIDLNCPPCFGVLHQETDSTEKVVNERYDLRHVYPLSDI